MHSTTGTKSQGEIQAMTAKNSNTNGISTNVVMDADATKSRTASNALRLAANEPTDAGLSAIRNVGEGLVAQLLAEHPGLWVARTADAAWTGALPPARAGAATDAYVYLIDPLGNLVLRYDETFNPKGMLKDLGRLLKYSRIG